MDGQKYDAHHDVGGLDSKSGVKLAAEGGHRVATVLLYLSDVAFGGETAFPDSEWADPANEAARAPWSECAEGVVAAKPRKGDGLLFWSLTPDYQIDPASMHTGWYVCRARAHAAATPPRSHLVVRSGRDRALIIVDRRSE